MPPTALFDPEHVALVRGNFVRPRKFRRSQASTQVEPRNWAAGLRRGKRLALIPGLPHFAQGFPPTPIFGDPGQRQSLRSLFSMAMRRTHRPFADTQFLPLIACASGHRRQKAEPAWRRAFLAVVPAESELSRLRWPTTHRPGRFRSSPQPTDVMGYRRN